MTSDREDGRGSHRWVAMTSALLSLVVLVLVIGEATERDDPEAATATTGVPPPSTSTDSNTTSTSSPTTTLGIEFPELSKAVPGVTGTLHALVGTSSRRLIEIPAEADATLLRPDSEPLGFVTGFEYDVSGTLLGFLDGGEDGSGSDRLNVWSRSSTFGFGDIGVGSYRWHRSQPRRLAAITVDANGHAVLRTFEFGAESLVAGIDTVIEVAEDEAIVGWGDYGFVIEHYDPRTESDVTALLDQEGNVTWERHEITVLDASPEEILAQFGSGEHYVVGAANPDAVRLLLALPDGATLTGSDFSSEGQLAVHYPLEDRNSNLRIYDAGLETFTDFVIEGWRVWDLEWSADGRFILMPGTDDGGGHVVIFYDTLAAEMYLFYLNTWVQWADLN